MNVLSTILYIIMVIDIIFLIFSLPSLLIGFFTCDDEKALKPLIKFWKNLNINVNPIAYYIILACAVGTGFIAFIVYTCVFGKPPFGISV